MTTQRNRDLRRLGKGAVVAKLVAGLLLTLVGCQEPPARHDGPILFITIDTLRADVLGALGGPEGLTPHLDRLAAESHWSGRAIATSSWTVPSMASIFTGLQPFRHGSWDGDHPVLRDDLETLPEALQAAGYATHGYRTNRWLRAKYGYGQGFDTFQDLKTQGEIRRRLEELTDRKELIWAHVLPPHAPYELHDRFFDRLEAIGASDHALASQVTTDREALPQKVRPRRLEPFFDPRAPLPADERAVALSLYLLHVARSDEIVGGILDAVRQSEAWDDTMIVITADHGEEFGERGQVLHGGNLDRVLIEVPLFIKLPKDMDRAFQSTPLDRPSNHRVFATILDSVGQERAGDVAPSLFAPPEPALSELYQGNGENAFSLVAGGEQLLWTARFAPEEPEYFAARLVELGQRDASTISEPAAEIFARVRARFAAAKPLSGNREKPELELVAWGESDSAASQDELARTLRSEWVRRNGEQVPPNEIDDQLPAPTYSAEELEQLRQLGYVVLGDAGAR